MQLTMAIKAVPSRQLVPKSFTTTPVVLGEKKRERKQESVITRFSSRFNKPS
jgi:hypothetical protein